MENLEAFVAKFLADISALPEEKMRLDLLGRRLAGIDAGDAARFIDILYRKTDDLSAGKARALLVDPEGLKGAIGSVAYRKIYLASIDLGLRKVSRLFTDLPPRKKAPSGYDQEEEAPMEFLTLGQRRAMSKSFTRETLNRLLSDPDPMVIANLLNNPKVTEKEILKIASKRPNSPNILRLIARHKVWSKRYGVARAIILNPYAMPRVSIALLEAMLTQDLRLISDDKTLHPQIRLSAKELLDEKEKSGKE